MFLKLLNFNQHIKVSLDLVNLSMLSCLSKASINKGSPGLHGKIIIDFGEISSNLT